MNYKMMFAGLIYILSSAISAGNANEVEIFQAEHNRIDDLKMILEDASRTGQKVFVEEFTGLS